MKCHPSNLGANKNSVPLRPQIQAVLEYAVALLNDIMVVDQVKLLYQQYGALREAMKEEDVLRVLVGFVSQPLLIGWECVPCCTLAFFSNSHQKRLISKIT